jgi:hypothetical protein
MNTQYYQWSQINKYNVVSIMYKVLQKSADDRELLVPALSEFNRKVSQICEKLSDSLSQDSIVEYH